MGSKIKTPTELANEHWNWLEAVLLKQFELSKMLYTTAFTHGYKHGFSDGENKASSDLFYSTFSKKRNKNVELIDNKDKVIGNE